MDEFDQQVNQAPRTAEEARLAERAKRALDEKAAEQLRATNDSARISLDTAWRRVHAAITVRNPEPDALFVPWVAPEEGTATRKMLFPRISKPRNAMEQPKGVPAWELSEQLGFYVQDSEISGTFFYRAFLAADSKVYCVDGYTECAPNKTSGYVVHFGPGDDLSTLPRIHADYVLHNYGRIKAGLANLVVRYDLKI